jgi:hypothetical protein
MRAMKTDKVNIRKEFVSTRGAGISAEISIFPVDARGTLGPSRAVAGLEEAFPLLEAVLTPVQISATNP